MARLGSVIPAKAGIQANSAQQTWIPACAGMTSRGEHMWKQITAFSFSAGERKIMAHFVVRIEFYFMRQKICATYDNF